MKFLYVFRKGEKRLNAYYVNVRSCGGSRNNFATSRKRETTLKEAVKWSTGMVFLKCNLDFSILSNFCRIETYCVFDGLDEEMILIGMATRRSILSPTSECIKATVDSSIGFQISIPERGVAFQQQLLSSPTRTTGKLFESGWLHANAFKNVNEGFMANQWQLSNWSWFSLE